MLITGQVHTYKEDMQKTPRTIETDHLHDFVRTLSGLMYMVTTYLTKLCYRHSGRAADREIQTMPYSSRLAPKTTLLPILYASHTCTT